MSFPPDPSADLRRLSPEALAASAQASLREHVAAQAWVARQKHGPITPDTLDSLLGDPSCLRYPTRLVFEFGEMALHQFAQPDLDPRDPERNGRVLYLRPKLRDRPGSVVQAVAYMIPLINYGEVISDEHCLLYGATLLGLTEEEYYRQMCALADWAGAETQLTTATNLTVSGSGCAAD
jgi:hypothetical protein